MAGRMGAHVRHNAVAYVALFFALTGSAYALARGEVKSKHIAANAVKTGHVAPSAVKRAKVAPNAIDASRVADDSLGGADVNESTLSLALGGLNSPATNENLAPVGETSLIRQDTFTTDRAGRALVFAKVPQNAPQCTSASCWIEYALYVDQVPVPGTLMYVASSGASGTAQTAIGLTPELPAGEHAIAVRARTSPNVAGYTSGATEIGAVALSD